MNVNRASKFSGRSPVLDSVSGTVLVGTPGRRLVAWRLPLVRLMPTDALANWLAGAGKAPWPKKEKLAIEAEPPTAIAIQPNLVNRGHTIAGLPLYSTATPFADECTVLTSTQR